MIIYTKFGKKFDVPFLTAYDGGVWMYDFSGDATYTDPFDGSVWIWDVKNVDEVIGVNQEGIALFVTESIADCEALEGSFYWDDENMGLYVHWYDSAGDWAIDREISVYAEITAGYANGYNRQTRNVFDGVYYRSIITELSGFKRSADPLALGLLASEESSIKLTNEGGEFDYQSMSEVIGVPVWTYLVEDDAVVLADADRIFTGICNGFENDREEYEIKVQEQRSFEDRPCCRNVITVAEFPDCGDVAGEFKPVAFGDIRRGILVALNQDALTDAGGETARVLLADPAIASMVAEGGGYTIALYNEKGTDISAQITSFDETTCILEFTTIAGASPNDIKNYKWQGRGYDIDGTYNNGLDIMRAAFLYFSNIPYLASTFNTFEWGTEHGLNTEAVGISVQSDKGFIAEILEPICTSLQGSVEIMGDGKITFNARDTGADVAAVVPKIYQMDEPEIQGDPEETISELVVGYAPDFTQNDDDDKYLQTLYSADRDRVVTDYGIDRRDPISPLNTALYELADAVALAEDIMDIYSYPQNPITVESRDFFPLRVFDIVGIDSGKEGSDVWEYGEVLAITPNYNAMTQKISIRVLPEYVPPVFVPGWPYGIMVPAISVYGLDSYGIPRYV